MNLKKTVAAAIAALCLSANALAAEPVDNFKILVPANPGGGFDSVGRTLGEGLQAAGLAKRVQVDNKAGAGGTIGLAQFINNAKGDPDSLFVAGLVTVGAIEANKPPVDLSMVTPIARLMGEYNVLVVPANSPHKTLKELLEAVKANPGAVSFGGGSAGGVDHIMAGLLAKEIGVDPAKVNYVPYAGGGEGTAAILGGHIAAYISGYSELASLIKAGKVRALALSADKRLEGVDIPTLKEQGVNVVLYNWRAVFGEPKLSAEQTKALIDKVQAAVQTPAWKDKAAKFEWIDLYLAGDDFAKFLAEEQNRVAQIIPQLKLGK
ncbi:MAG TPA: tripartite tricarboxylate transporter substrate-binding protein [Candidatus Competibacteraceae bacterium]|nr:tripartite tricarboxylate transporter substrate-binding protein [Candidatus Competibacteraceae bacterium]